MAGLGYAICMNDLALALDGSFHGRGWQGPTLLGSIRGVTPSEAVVVPAKLKHSIWGLVLHAAYWKYAVCLRVTRAGFEFGSLPLTETGELFFPRSPSNFPSPPTKPTGKSWRADVALLKLYHTALVDAASRLSKRQLDSIPPGGKRWTVRPMLLGVAAHDAYHCGQIQLIKRLVRRGRGSGGLG